jgi:hypothetical protein
LFGVISPLRVKARFSKIDEYSCGGGNHDANIYAILVGKELEERALHNCRLCGGHCSWACPPDLAGPGMHKSFPDNKMSTRQFKLCIRPAYELHDPHMQLLPRRE